MRAGARVAQDEYEKENVADFALWKAWDEQDGAVRWDSPWGTGRPGWHIECSAMSMRYLGESFDIHTGGVDNMFPHHDDEIAQSECATGKPFVRYWMHSAHLIVDGKKMSKSAGNFYTLRQVLEKGYSGREVRYVLLSAHYRQQLNFTFEAVDAAKVALGRIDDFTERLKSQGGAGGGLPLWAVEARQAFDDAMNQDLNVPEALAAVFALVHAGNKALDRGESGFGQDVLALVADMDLVLGVLAKPAAEVPAEAQALVDQRAAARAGKDWKASDRLRDALAAMGWIVRDTPEGQKVTQR
jgi:cysteinyl-tRNA synthetase